ncbi:DUF4132 domain-containing protein [Leptolyngbyaceae cyanobacterium UHCC 1019]
MVQEADSGSTIAVSEQSIQLILQDFERYQAPIPQAILKYLVEGGDAAVLQQLQERFILMLDERSSPHTWYQAPSYGLRSQLLHSLTTQDIEFYDRLTRAYEIEAENLKWHRSPVEGWLALFLICLVDLSQLRFALEPIALPSAVTAQVIESLLRRRGEAPDTLVRWVFLADVHQEGTQMAVRLAWIGVNLPQFSAYSLQYESVIRAALEHPDLEQRLHALDMLTVSQMSPVPVAALLVDRATGSSKQERTAALRVLQRESIAVVPFVEAQAQAGRLTERVHAIRLLGELIGTEARPFLEERLEIEKTATVQNAIQQTLQDLDSLSVPEPEILLSPLPGVELANPLPAIVGEIIHTLLHHCYELAQAKYDATECQRYPEIPQPQPPSDDWVDRVFQCLQFGTAEECLAIVPVYHYLIHPQIEAQFRQLLQTPQLDLIHVTRLLLLLQLMPIESETVPNAVIPQAWYWKEWEINADLQRWCQHRCPDSSLRYLAAGLEVLGIPGEVIAWKMLNREEMPFWGWGDRAIWEYFAERLPILDLLWGLAPFPQLYYIHEQSARRQLFRILEKFPQLPTRFVPPLWEVALNGLQVEMPLAQRCLDRRPGTQERLHQLLNHSDPAVQITAIHWLTRLQDRTVIPQLQAALRRRITGAVRDALLRSLEKLGADIEEFLDRSHLLQEAQDGLRKALPKALVWFPFSLLPPVHWQDTGEPVDRQILTWFIVQSYQQKNPEPSPLLRQYAKLWQSDDRQQFGQFVLESWINQDTQVTSATKEKGVLAVAGACGGAAIVPVINRYLKTYFGNRLAQCLALVQMLAWSNDFAVIQLLLAIANRFRTQKIQEAAQQCVHQLAERQGWTLAELGDRTIPWCGLAEDGSLLLNYGARQFTACLDGECKLILTDRSGKVLKSLPTAHKDDDAEQVKAAKQQWTATKKQVDLVRSQQQARLYEALCTQRSWTFADWELFLRVHPICGRLCQKVIWAMFTDHSTQPIQTFRSQADQTIVDVEGNLITLSPTAIVRLAQATLLTPELTQAWQQHLITAQINPLFERWTAVYAPPAASQQMMSISDFAGLSLDQHPLRHQAMQLGYLPHSEDFEHGWTVEYRKQFESLNLSAVIACSGHPPVNQDDFEVQLGELFFLQQERQLSLAEVPPVLLSIVWSEIHTISGKGTP